MCGFRVHIEKSSDGTVLNYIGVPWEDAVINLENQLSLV